MVGAPASITVTLARRSLHSLSAIWAAVMPEPIRQTSVSIVRVAIGSSSSS
jgi:hypothetical protein